jgi:hypothetical protein
MKIIGFLCASLDSSTVQLHDSLGSRHACACSEGVSGVKMATVLRESNTEEQGSVVRFCGQKDSIQRIFINKCFLFTVGSVGRVKRSLN